MLLAPNITEPFDIPVWRMHIDETTDTLFLELRDTKNKQVSFAGIDLVNQKINFKNLQMPERWLSGLESAADGVLLLHGYLSETMPVHKGLAGIDGTTGALLWTDYNLAFDALAPAGFAVFDTRIQPKKLFIVTPSTGQRNGLAITGSGSSESFIIMPEMVQSDVVPPELLLLQPHAKVVHYLKHNNFRIVSLHALGGGLLNQHLYIFDANNRLVFEDIMNSDIQKLQPEAFISYKNKLIWLKNRSVLKVLNL